jgi:transposase
MQVRAAADPGDLAAPGELIGDGDRVRGLAAGVQVQDGFMDQLVSWTVVVDRPDHLDHVRDGVLGEQHPAERTLLRGNVVRRCPLEVISPRRDLGNAHEPLLPLPRLRGPNAPLRSLNTVVADGSVILAARRAGHQPQQWTMLWTRCADTPARLCAGWGKHCGRSALASRRTSTSCGDTIHWLCGRKTW